MRLSLRGPTVLLAVGVLLLLAAAVLNAGGEQSRNWALLFSAASLAVVLPIAVLWLFAVVLLRRRR
jgi:hypothetical protein